MGKLRRLHGEKLVRRPRVNIKYYKKFFKILINKKINNLIGKKMLTLEPWIHFYLEFSRIQTETNAHRSA